MALSTAAAAEKKVSVGQMVRVLFISVPAYFKMEELIGEAMVEAKQVSATELMQKGSKYSDIRSKSRELESVRELAEYVYRQTIGDSDKHEDPVSGILKRFLKDHCANLGKQHSEAEKPIETHRKAEHDMARVLLIAATNPDEKRQYASIVATYRHMKNENSKLGRQVKGFELALKWYDFAYKSCLSDKITAPYI